MNEFSLSKNPEKLNRWITKKYLEAKKLVQEGLPKTIACKQVGISYESYMRRQRIEKTGSDRASGSKYKRQIGVP